MSKRKPRDSGRASGHEIAPAHGERRAIGGYTSQYRLAGARTYAALRQGEFLWVRLADPAAGRVDDFQVGVNGRVDAYQVKWSRYSGTLTFRDFTRKHADAPSYIAQLADGWTRLRSVHTGARVVVHFVTNDVASTADRLSPVGQRARGSATASVGTFAAFLAECWRPARAAAVAGADIDAVVSERWHAAWEALQQAAGLAADNWPAFVRDCELEFGTPGLDAAAGGAGGQAVDAADWRDDVDALSTLFQRLVADPKQQVQFSRDEVLDALGWRGRVEYRHRHEFPDPDVPYRAVTSTVRAVRDAITAFPSGYVAVVGTPGSGKSTLLTRTLRYAPERVIRYYAYVPTSIGPNVRRGEASHFLHDLVVALERQGIRAGVTLPREDVTRLAERFEAQLQVLSDEWQRTGRKTILLVDGLDHIPREQSPTQSLLTELPHPDRVPEGVLIILGSQTDHLPGLAAAVRDQLDQLGRRLTMQPLTREDVLAIVRETQIGPVPTADEQDRVFALTAGHPLALNFVLNRLRGSGGRPVAEVLDQIAPFRDRIDVQYVAHWQQVESDFGLVRLLALLARLRGAIRMRWIELWAPPEAVYRLVREFGYYFRQEPNGRWAFFHNSFRAFLIERTRGLPGLGPEQALYLDLAKQCAASAPGDPSRWDELYYRSRAGDHGAVLALAQPGILREQFLTGRPADAISADVIDAVTAAMATRDVVGLTRTLLLDAEFAQRAHYEGLLPLAELKLALGDTDAAIDAVRDGAQLRVEPEAALRAAAALDTHGLHDEARAVFALAEPADVLGASTPIEGHQLGEVQSQLSAWVEVAPRFRGVQELLAVVERLRVSDDRFVQRNPGRKSRQDASEPQGVDEDLTDDLHGRLLQVLVGALDRLGRPKDADAVSTHLFDSDIAGGSAWFWAAVNGWRHAHSVGDHLRAKQRLQAMRDGLARWSGGALDTDETAALAEGLVRVAGDAHAARALVSPLPQPAPVSALTASGSGDGFGPFVPRFVLNRVLGAVGDERPLSEVVPDAEGEGQPLVFFERAVVTVARLNGAAWAGRLLSTASFVSAAVPVLRLFSNVGHHHWREGWHLAVAARGELYELLVRAAALHGPDVVASLRSSLDRIWADPSLGAAWPPELKRRVVLALLDAGVARTWAAEHLRGTEAQHFEGEALEQELPEAAGQVRAWLAVGDADAARTTLRTVLAASFGVEYKDYQLDHWVRWGTRANRRDPAEAPSRIARLAAAVGGIRGAHGATSATKSLIQAAATGGSALAFAVAEWCMEHGLTGWVASLDSLLPAVLAGAPRAAPTAAAFYRHLMLPFDRHPSSNVLSAVVRALDGVDAGDRNRARAVLADGIDVHGLGSARPALRATLAGDDLNARRLERDGSVVEPTDLFRVVDEFEGLGLTLLELQARTRTMADVHDLFARVKSDAYMIRWELVFGGFVAAATADEVRELLRLLPSAEKTWNLRLLAADRLVAIGLPDEARQVIDAVLRGTSPSGWAKRYDGGSRTSALEALARIDRPLAAAQTWALLREDVAADRIGARALLPVWDRVVTLLADDPPDAELWDEVAPYVDALVAHADTLPGPVLPAHGDPTDADAAAAAFVTFAAARLEHPALALAQAAQRFMVDQLLTGDRHAQRCIALALAGHEQSAESALVVLTAVATVDPDRVRFAASELMSRARVPHYRERRMIADLMYALGKDEDSTGTVGDTIAPRPLAPAYQLHHPPAPPADGLGEPGSGQPLPGALHPIHLLRIIEGELRIVARMAGVQPEALFSDVVTRAGGISPALDDEGPVRDQLEHYGLRIGFRRPRGRRVFRAALAAVADLADHGRLDASHVEALDVLFRNADPDLLVLRPGPRPDVVAPIRERVEHADETGRYVRDDWTGHVTAEASAVGRLDAQGRVVLAEETWLRWLDWKMATETRVGVRSLPEATPSAPIGDRGALDAKHRAGHALGARCVEWSHQQVADYLIADTGGPMLVVRQDAFRYVTPASHWLAFNPALARALGWQPSEEGKFRWQDASGAVMVESVWWADGFVGHQPPLSDEEVGAGWLVVATADAWRQIVRLVGPTLDWVRVERSMNKGSPPRVVERTDPGSASSADARFD